MTEPRRVFWWSIVSLLLAPAAAVGWFAGDEPAWWAWAAALAASAVGIWPSIWSWREVASNRTLSDADRKVWRGWLRTAGPFAVPFFARTIARSATNMRAGAGGEQRY